MQTTEQSFNVAMKERRDVWVPACGGTETPFTTRTGRRLLYCYNPAQWRHAYLDVDQDRILTDEEAMAALGLTS